MVGKNFKSMRKFIALNFAFNHILISNNFRVWQSCCTWHDATASSGSTWFSVRREVTEGCSRVAKVFLEEEVGLRVESIAHEYSLWCIDCSHFQTYIIPFSLWFLCFLVLDHSCSLWLLLMARWVFPSEGVASLWRFSWAKCVTCAGNILV